MTRVWSDTMTVIEFVAKELQMSPKELEKESLRSYLEKQLLKVESEIFRLAKKFGVSSVFELDKKLKDGRVGQKDAFEEYFALNHLESERDKIRAFLEKL